MATSYRSAMGKPVDMAAIRNNNEKVRAVGNMQVNARGDLIDSNNQIIEPASQRVNRVYTKTTQAKTPEVPQADVQPTTATAAVPTTSTIRRVEPVAPIQPSKITDLFEELSEHEMEFDQIDSEVAPPDYIETKTKKK